MSRADDKTGSVVESWIPLGRIDLFNLCRTTHRDNYSPDIKNNNTVPTALMPTPNVNSNVGERNLPVEQANQKNMEIEAGLMCG